MMDIDDEKEVEYITNMFKKVRKDNIIAVVHIDHIPNSIYDCYPITLHLFELLGSKFYVDSKYRILDL